MGSTALETAARTSGELGHRPLRPKNDASLCNVCDLVLEADHRIANHLAMLSAYVRLKKKDLARQPAPLTDASVQLAFDGVCAQIEAISHLHRALATRNRPAGIDLGEYLHQVCTPFMSGLSGAIAFSEDFQPDCLVRSELILPLTQIVSEVITNAIKYSHARGETGRISVSCHFVTDKELEIEIVDDGTGLPQLFDPLTAGGLGFRLIRALTAKAEATSGFESSATGTRFWLRMANTPQISDPD